ncbi:MAG: ABC transporter ATP-binding protein/permease [Lachnospiraceae bacterium]|nr:ABC transporter ATP-binding protein/permease [Lachnospiraceae bacterium]
MIKKLASYIKEFKTATILTPTCAALEVVMETLLPLMMAGIIDKGITPGNMSEVYKYGAIMIAMAFASLTFGVVAGRLAAKAGAGFAANIRTALYDNIQTFAFKNIDKFSTSGLITRLTTDVTNLQNAFQMILRMAVRAPMTLLCALVMAFSISMKISMVFVGAVLFLGIVMVIIVRATMKLFDQVFKRYDELNESVQENVSAIRVVKSFVREDYERKKFNNAADNIYKMFVKAESNIALNSPIMNLAVYTCVLSISWIGAHMISSGELTTGELTTLLSYIMAILFSLMMLSMIFVMITISLASIRRIYEVLEEESSLVNPENPDYDIPDGSVDFDHVTFSYNESGVRPVLKDIDLHIASGETIGIIGGTGSSKSSLVNLISRLYDVTEGCVKVGGKDVRTYDLETLRNNVSVVLQKNVLFSGTILDNLRWGDENATEEECIRACKLACADEFITQMPDGYETHIEQGGTNVSGGQKQRLCIARALLKKPKILILDDSTSAVDTATDARIRKAFRDEIPGTTKFIIAQRISSVQDADRIIVLENGEVNAFGTHEELLETNEIYKEVFESQTQGSGDFDEKGGVA